VVVSLKAIKANPECSVDCVMTVLQGVTIGNGQQRLTSVKKKASVNRNHVNKENKNKD
jgi:hypothetical protein